MDLKDLLPIIIKLKDSETTPEILQGYVDVLQQEYNTMRDLILDLSTLVNPDSGYKKYLMALVSPEDLTGVTSWVLQNIVYLHKIKGTNQSWQQYWEWLLGEDDIDVVELQKYIRYEAHTWDLSGPLKSAKIWLTCETVAEIDELSKDAVDYYFEKIEVNAPVNVRVRPNVTPGTVEETIEVPEGTLGCPNCETICVSGCESEIEIWAGSGVSGGISDTVGPITDNIRIVSRCINVCETSCQDCCETSCECDACELFCETGCETSSTHGVYGGGACNTLEEVDPCDMFCEFPCQFNCQGVNAELGCAVFCQFGNCQGGACVNACQAACVGGGGACEGGAPCEVVACQQVCELTCQSPCECGCQSGCTEGCEAVGCEMWCATACQWSCQGGCTNGACEMIPCQAGCVVGCQPDCEAACQTGCEALCEGSCTGPDCQCIPPEV